MPYIGKLSNLIGPRDILCISKLAWQRRPRRIVSLNSLSVVWEGFTHLAPFVTRTVVPCRICIEASTLGFSLSPGFRINARPGTSVCCHDACSLPCVTAHPYLIKGSTNLVVDMLSQVKMDSLSIMRVMRILAGVSCASQYNSSKGSGFPCQDPHRRVACCCSTCVI
jgi:hypothetical protein